MNEKYKMSVDWAPARIYLQRGIGEDGTHTWCADSQDEHEQAEYVRVDVRGVARVALQWTAGTLQEIVSGRWKGAKESDKVSIGSVTKTVAQVLDMAEAALADPAAPAASPHIDTKSSLCERLIAAVEGECDGLSITDEQASNILAYLQYGRAMGDLAEAFCIIDRAIGVAEFYEPDTAGGDLRIVPLRMDAAKKLRASIFNAAPTQAEQQGDGGAIQGLVGCPDCTDEPQCAWDQTCQRKAEQPSAPVALSYPDELTDDLREVLGWLCFQCAPIARAMRAAGVDIKPKAEDEQAHVLHWMVKLVLRHGANWRAEGSKDIGAWKAILAASAAQTGESK